MLFTILTRFPQKATIKTKVLLTFPSVPPPLPLRAVLVIALFLLYDVVIFTKTGDTQNV